MLSVCRQYIKDHHFAEDVMVNGFVKVFKNLGTFRNEGSFEGWMRRIMIHEAISYLRRNQFVVFDSDIFENAANEEIVLESALNEENIQSLIDSLPEGYKMVFVLFAVEGYKHHEIAAMLQISESTSKTQLFKARQQLQKKIRGLELSKKIHS